MECFRKKKNKQVKNYFCNLNYIYYYYNLFIVPAEIVKIIGEIPSKTTTNKEATEKVVFSNQPNAVAGRQKSSDFPINKPGVTSFAKEAKTQLECFQLFVTDDLIECILTCTKKKICQLPEPEKYPEKAYAKPVGKTDIQSFFGIMYMRGLYCLNNHEISTLFSDIHGYLVFSATKIRMRFQFILANLAFDDLSDREMCWKEYRLAAMRYVFEECNKNFAKVIVPDFYLSLEETLYPMRNQISFRQYNLDKPALYGTFYKSINSAAF